MKDNKVTSLNKYEIDLLIQQHLSGWLGLQKNRANLKELLLYMKETS